MTIIALQDVKAELPKITITPTSVPSEAQVTNWIGDTEAEVRALIEACPAPWPDPVKSPTAASFIRRTILEGVRFLVMRSVFELASAGATGQGVAITSKAYDDRKKDLCEVARSVRNEVDSPTPGNPMPAITRSAFAPNLAATFAEYTLARDVVDTVRSLNVAQGTTRPWPLD